MNNPLKTKNKRIIVHHDAPMLSYYQRMFYNKISPYYMQFAKMNQGWAPSIEKNDFYNQVMANQHYMGAINQMKEHFPEQPSAMGGSTGSSTSSSSMGGGGASALGRLLYEVPGYI